jgi:excisionase family DNA binding protein
VTQDILMTPSEAAALLGVSADTVRNYSDEGKLPTLRTVTGRRLFRRSDVKKLREVRRKRNGKRR